MPDPDFIVARPKNGGRRIIIDRINLNDDYEEIGVPELLSGGPVPLKPHVSLPKASTAKAAPAGDSTKKKEG